MNNYFGMAQLYQDAGRVEEAEQMLLRAKEVAPNSVDVQLQLAGFYNKQGNFDKTMEAFQARIQLEPNNPEAYHTVAGYFEEKVRKDYTISPAVKADYIKRGLEASDQGHRDQGRLRRRDGHEEPAAPPAGPRREESRPGSRNC